VLLRNVLALFGIYSYYKCKFISKWPIIAEKSKITHQSTAFPIVRCSCLRVALLDCRSSVELRKIFKLV